ncbi:MAG: HNH endonuclease [Victivallales bacterium]|nr:HNH endonuclease [Victivallales bacterium]
MNFYASKIRKGQQKFRKRLMYIYQNRCVVTGWGPDDVLEAAHIYPFSESGINQITNGLILRADIHCLFDSYLLNIHPETFEIVLDSSLEETGYWEFNKRKISKSIDEQYPAKKFLHLRWDIAHSISVETNQY